MICQVLLEIIVMHTCTMADERKTKAALLNVKMWHILNGWYSSDSKFTYAVKRVAGAKILPYIPIGLNHHVNVSCYIN